MRRQNGVLTLQVRARLSGGPESEKAFGSHLTLSNFKMAKRAISTISKKNTDKKLLHLAYTVLDLHVPLSLMLQVQKGLSY